MLRPTLLIIIAIIVQLTSGSVPEVTLKWGPYVQQITEPFEHSEEAFWDYRNQILYFVDIHQGTVHSFNPATNALTGIKFLGGVTATPIVPTYTPNKFSVGLNRSVVLFYWDGSNGIANNYTTITTVEKNKLGNRFNDGKADKKGRLWWGTIGPEVNSVVVPNQAGLYKITRDNYKNPEKVLTVTNSNGLAWSKDNTKFFYIDTPTRKIAKFDFDLDKGEISNKEIIFNLDDYNLGGIPDGMTIDENDNLFVALYDGGLIIKVDPRTHKLLQKIAIPAQRVTSCAFGGKDLDILFVTTSRYGLSELENSYQPAAGSLFAVTNLQTRGVHTHFADF